MKIALAILTVVLVLVSGLIQLSEQKTECETKRESAERLVKQQDKNQSLNLAIVVPKCNEDGSYATLQCHHNSQFCQCWDKEGSPLTQPKKNLKKCACLTDRAKALKSIPPSQTEIPEVTSCEIDGSYKAKQCNRSACWCVNPESGKKITADGCLKSGK